MAGEAVLRVEVRVQELKSTHRWQKQSLKSAQRNVPKTKTSSGHSKPNESACALRGPRSQRIPTPDIQLSQV